MLYTFIDLETTGLLKYDANYDLIPDILEASFLCVNSDTLRIVKNGTLWFYQPHFDIENDAQRIHHITRDFLMQFEDQFEENVIALQALVTNSTLISKNGKKFDIPFIKHWVTKYVGNRYDIGEITCNLGMKAYDEKSIVKHFSEIQSVDMQDLYAPVYRVKAYMKALDEYDKFESPEFTQAEFDMYDSQTDHRKKGKLEEYIASIKNGRELVEMFYEPLAKDISTKEHGGLYDCVMTYVVWLDYIILKGRLK